MSSSVIRPLRLAYRSQVIGVLKTPGVDRGMSSCPRPAAHSASANSLAFAIASLPCSSSIPSRSDTGAWNMTPETYLALAPSRMYLTRS